MENKLVSAVVIFFILLFVYAKFGPAIPFSVNQITTNKADLFSVSADGKVFAKPDIAQVNLGFSAKENTVINAQNKANSVINKISSDLKKIGIEEKDIRTVNYNLRRDREGGYLIDVNLEVKVRDFEKINSAIDTATNDGANQIGDLSFSVDDTEKYQEQARKIAIDKAKQKASKIASDAGINLGKIVNVIDANNAMPRVYMDKALASTGTNIEPGQSEITISVTLQYEAR